MTWADWAPAITSSTVLAVLGFLAGTYYRAKVEKTVQHRLDRQLEEPRAKLRTEEESLRADLRSKEDQIAALRSGMLSGITQRQAGLDKRRLEALERLWAATVSRSRLKILSQMASAIEMEKAIEMAAQQSPEALGIREFADVIWKASGAESYTADTLADNERPFLQPLTWALFSAYRQVLTLPVAQIAAMRTGVGGKLLADPKPILELVKSALPHQSSFVDSNGTVALPYLVNELEEKLLTEITADLERRHSDSKNLQQASDILKAVTQAAAATQPAPVAPAAVRV
jgi:cell division protein FtsB